MGIYIYLYIVNDMVSPVQQLQLSRAASMARTSLASAAAAMSSGSNLRAPHDPRPWEGTCR